MDMLRVTAVLCFLQLVGVTCMEQVFDLFKDTTVYNDFMTPLFETNAASSMECASYCLRYENCMATLVTLDGVNARTGRGIYRCQLYFQVLPPTLRGGPAPGFDYYIKKNVLDEVLRLSSWLAFPDMLLSDLDNRKFYQSMSASDCQLLCEQETSFVCFSVDYTPTSCFLSGSTRATFPAHFIPSVGSTFYERVL